MKKTFAILLMVCFGALSTNTIYAQNNMGYHSNSEDGGFRVSKKMKHHRHAPSDNNGFVQGFEMSNSHGGCGLFPFFGSYGSSSCNNWKHECCKEKRECAHEKKYNRESGCCGHHGNSCCSSSSRCASHGEASACKHSTKKACCSEGHDKSSSKKACCSESDRAHCSKKSCAHGAKSSSSHCEPGCKKACCAHKEASCKPGGQKECCKKEEKKNTSRYYNNRY